jgi:hypothetical protein
MLRYPNTTSSRRAQCVSSQDQAKGGGKTMAEIVSVHRNSEGEKITIERVTSGAFKGRLILCIYDDDNSTDWRAKLGQPTCAPMLLDEGTADWLRRQLDQVTLEAIEDAVNG